MEDTDERKGGGTQDRGTRRKKIQQDVEIATVATGWLYE